MPLYQTKQDKKNESSFKKRLLKKNPTLTLVGTSKAHPFDFFIGVGDEPFAIGEYKRRFNDKHTYRDYQVDWTKVESLAECIKEYGTRSYLFIEWDDGIQFHRIRKSMDHYSKGYMRRNHMRDGYDEDETAIIPLDEFQPMSKFKKEYRMWRYYMLGTLPELDPYT